MKTNIENKLTSLPSKPGVYILKDKENQALYVGKAKALRSRVRSYFQKSRPIDTRLKALIEKTRDIEFIVTDSDIEALILEANLIKEFKPRYNINLKDDKSYPYIRITNEDFPQVFPTRKVINDGSVYFGPYTNVKEIRFALTTLKRLFAIRSCKFNLNEYVVANKKVPLCLDYYINKCQGPCQGLQSKEEYANTIEKIKQFLKGKTANILVELQEEMQELAAGQKYEDAARVRDKIDALEKYRNTQKVVTSDLTERDIFAIAQEDDDACAVIFKIREGKIIGRIHYYLSGVLYGDHLTVLQIFLNQYYNRTDEIPQEIYLPYELEDASIIEEWLRSRSDHKVKLINPKVGDKKKLIEMCAKNAHYLLKELKLQKLKSKDFIPHAVKSLQRDLKMTRAPRRIECFDISNIQGSDAVASMVCFVDGKAKKGEYRRFRIRSKTKPDDFAMMREVLYRRYSRVLKENKELPGLIVVDGGKGQLSSAVSVLKQLQILNQPVIGLAKRLEEIFIPGFSDAQMIPKTSSSLKLLQQIRDEAHRFALTYHRERRKKRTLHSSLDTIPGIGPRRRNHILRVFGSMKELKKVSANEISRKTNISPTLAQRIFDFLHEKK
jgi:excinuclease ABC subunit C